MSIEKPDLAGDSAWMVAPGAIDVLIARHIDADPHGLGPALARLRDHHVSVWTLIAEMNVLDGDLEEIADSYALPEEAVLAVMYYYWRHRDVIDAHIAANRTVLDA